MTQTTQSPIFFPLSYFQEVLSSPLLSSETSEVQLHKDGSWSIQNVEKKVVTKLEKVPLDDSIEIISDDIEVISGGDTTATSSTDKVKEDETPAAAAPAKLKEKDVVDLTLSDSDDDEPLAKRRQLANPKPDSTIKFSGEFFMFCRMFVFFLFEAGHKTDKIATRNQNRNR